MKKYERIVIRTSGRDELEENLDAGRLSAYRLINVIEWSGADYTLVFEREYETSESTR